MQHLSEEKARQIIALAEQAFARWLTSYLIQHGRGQDERERIARLASATPKSERTSSLQLVRMLDGLSEPEARDLLALSWLGQGLAATFEDARQDAMNAMSAQDIGGYLSEKGPLAEYLTAGMSKLGKRPKSAQPSQEAAPVCEECKRSLPDWEGDVMVPLSAYLESPEHRKIPEIRVICKECTHLMDTRATPNDWHNLWELGWVKERPIDILAVVASGFASDQPTIRFSRGAIRSVFHLVSLAHPDLSGGDVIDDQYWN